MAGHVDAELRPNCSLRLGRQARRGSRREPAPRRDRRGRRKALPFPGSRVPLNCASHVVRGPGEEVVQSLHAHHRRRKRRRNLWIAHVADVRLALDTQVVNLGVEGALHLRCLPAEADRHAILGDLIHRETMPGQPVGDGRNVGLRGAEVLAHLLGSEPPMEVGRGWIVLAGHKLVEGCLLLGTAAQHKDHVGHGQAWADPAKIVPGVCRRVGVAHKGHKPAFVDLLDDPNAGRELLGHRRCSAEQCAGQYTKGKRTHQTHSGFPGPFLRRRPPSTQELAVPTKRHRGTNIGEDPRHGFRPRAPDCGRRKPGAASKSYRRPECPPTRPARASIVIRRKPAGKVDLRENRLDGGQRACCRCPRRI